MNELFFVAGDKGINTKDNYWPKGANALSRRLKELSIPLKQNGLLVTINTTGVERYIQIENTKLKPETDDTDDIFGKTKPMTTNDGFLSLSSPNPQ